MAATAKFEKTIPTPLPQDALKPFIERQFEIGSCLKDVERNIDNCSKLISNLESRISALKTVIPHVQELHDLDVKGKDVINGLWNKAINKKKEVSDVLQRANILIKGCQKTGREDLLKDLLKAITDVNNFYVDPAKCRIDELWEEHKSIFTEIFGRSVLDTLDINVKAESLLIYYQNELESMQRAKVYEEDNLKLLHIQKQITPLDLQIYPLRLAMIYWKVRELFPIVENRVNRQKMFGSEKSADADRYSRLNSVFEIKNVSRSEELSILQDKFERKFSIKFDNLENFKKYFDLYRSRVEKVLKNAPMLTEAAFVDISVAYAELSQSRAVLRNEENHLFYMRMQHQISGHKDQIHKLIKNQADKLLEHKEKLPEVLSYLFKKSEIVISDAVTEVDNILDSPSPKL